MLLLFRKILKSFSYNFSPFCLFLLQKDFDFFRVLLFRVLFCVADKIYMLFFTYEKKKIIKNIFNLIFFIENLFIRIIRKNVITNILWHPFFFNNIFTFFWKHLRIIIFTCFKNSHSKLLISKYTNNLLLVFYYCWILCSSFQFKILF